MIVALHGELGSGKTTLVRGLVAAVSADPVSSPTYVYHVRYQMTEIRIQMTERVAPSSVLRPPSSGLIDHVDLYRVHPDPTLRTRSLIDELLADVPGWLLIEWPLADLAYPSDLPRLTIEASGPPVFRFTLTASWPLAMPPEDTP